MRSQVPLAAFAALLVAGATACTGGGDGSASGGGTTAVASPTTTAVRADATATPPPPRPTATEVPTVTGDPLRPGTDRLLSGDGVVTWDVELPAFAGTPVGDTVDSRVDVSTRFGVQAVEEGGYGGSYVAGRGTTTTNDGRTVQVRVTLDRYPPTGGDPVQSVTTVALRTQDGSPVFLQDVLADPDRAWRVLAERFAAVAAEQGAEAVEPLSATPGQFADWQTSSDGLEVSFQAGEFGPGAPLFVVPWSDVEPLLTPDGAALLAPPR